MNLPGIASLHAALGFLADTGLDIIRAHELSLTQRFLSGLAPLCAAERVKLLGLPGIEGRAGVVSIQTPGCDLADIAFASPNFVLRSISRSFGVKRPLCLRPESFIS